MSQLQSKTTEEPCTTWCETFKAGDEVIYKDMLGNVVSERPSRVPDGHIPIRLTNGKNEIVVPDDVTRVF